jgi:SulP family sulfate permease
MGAGREQALPRGGRTAEGVVIYRLSGAFFFGTASTVGAVFDRIDSGYRAFVIDFSAVPFIDSTAANVMAGIGRRAARKRHSRRRGSRA